MPANTLKSVISPSSKRRVEGHTGLTLNFPRFLYLRNLAAQEFINYMQRHLARRDTELYKQKGKQNPNYERFEFLRECVITKYHTNWVAMSTSILAPLLLAHTLTANELNNGNGNVHIKVHIARAHRREESVL